MAAFVVFIQVQDLSGTKAEIISIKIIRVMNPHQGDRCIIAQFDDNIAIGIKMHVVLDLAKIIVVPFRPIDDVFPRRENRNDVMARGFAQFKLFPAGTAGQGILPGACLKTGFTAPPPKPRSPPGIAPKRMSLPFPPNQRGKLPKGF